MEPAPGLVPVQHQAFLAEGHRDFAAIAQTPGPSARPRAATGLFLAGACALMLGALVYLSDRHASASLGFLLGSTAIAPPLFGTLGQWLPSFVHPFAFVLFSAATRPADAALAHRACAFWWAVNVAFEAAQHPSLRSAVARAIEDALGRNGFTQPLIGYVLRGTFDVADLMAATAGALVAAQVLAWLRRRRSS